MITITLNQIKLHNPCRSGWEKVLKANGGTKADMDKPFPVSSIIDSNSLSNTLWVLRCLPEHEKLWRKFVWWCANEGSHLKKDDKVKSCIDAIWEYSEGRINRKELYSAACAARTTYAAGYTAATCAGRATYTAASSTCAAFRTKQAEKLKQILDTRKFIR